MNGFPCRVWTKGSGPKLGFLAGLGGLPRWLPFLDRLAETRTVIVPSLPGYPGATGHTELDTHLDWVLAVRQLDRQGGPRRRRSAWAPRWAAPSPPKWPRSFPAMSASWR